MLSYVDHKLIADPSSKTNKTAADRKATTDPSSKTNKTAADRKATTDPFPETNKVAVDYKLAELDLMASAQELTLPYMVMVLVCRCALHIQQS